MCNQRDVEALFRFQTTFQWHCRFLAGGSATEFMVVKGCGCDFRVTGQLNLPGGAGEVDLLPDYLIRSMFPRGLDTDGVLAGLHRLAVVVRAVPFERVLAGRTCGA